MHTPVMRQKVFVKIAVLVLVFFTFPFGSCSKPAPRSQPPVPVTTALVKKATIPLDIQAVGTVEPIQTVAVHAQVAGTLVQVNFEEGQDIKAGQVLFRIDPRPFQIALMQANAALERDKVQAANADLDAQRYKTLAQKSYVTKEQYESLRTASKAYRNVINLDEAAVAKAKLDLEYCTIRAPISGRTGNLFVKAGNLVRDNDAAALVVINLLDPILVRFALPESDLPLVEQHQSRGDLQATALPDGQSARLNGALSFVDNTVDTTTGTILLKARFDNSGHSLWPGRFARLSLRLGNEADVLVVPSQAVQTGQQGSYVFVVAADRTASVRTIKPGRTVDGSTIVESGLQLGEQVVVDGQLRLTQGAKVELEKAPEIAAEGSP